MNLLDFIEKTLDDIKPEEKSLRKYAYHNVSGSKAKIFLSDDELCFQIIQSEMEFDFKGLASYNRYRASHILVTWILGLGIARNLGIDGSSCKNYDCGFGETNFYRLWLQSAMLHDYGYFCKELSQSKISIKELCGKHDLLTDDYAYPFEAIRDLSKNGFSNYFTYSYEEIKRYYEYRQNKLFNNIKDHESLDHGIIGGCIAFDKYCEQVEQELDLLQPSQLTMQIEKIACMIAASHNIFKSEDFETDVEYKDNELGFLLSTSTIRITLDNPVLLLLSLVDTIECTKRFSKRENSSSYLIQTTTLKYVDIEFNKRELVCNFNRLGDYIKENKNDKMYNDLKDHVANIVKLKNWTCLNTRKIDDLQVAINIT